MSLLDVEPGRLRGADRVLGGHVERVVRAEDQAFRSRHRGEEAGVSGTMGEVVGPDPVPEHLAGPPGAVGGHVRPGRPAVIPAPQHAGRAAGAVQERQPQTVELVGDPRQDHPADGRGRLRGVAEQVDEVVVTQAGAGQLHGVHDHAHAEPVRLGQDRSQRVGLEGHTAHQRRHRDAADQVDVRQAPQLLQRRIEVGQR